MIPLQLLEYLTHRMSRVPSQRQSASCFDENQNPVWAYSYRDLGEHVKQNPSTLVRASIEIPAGGNTLNAGQVVSNVGLDLEVDGHHIRFSGVELTLIEATSIPASYASPTEPNQFISAEISCDLRFDGPGHDDGDFEQSISTAQPAKGSESGFVYNNGIKNSKSLYALQLCYLLSTENQIVNGLPSMIEHAYDLQLRQAFQSNLRVTTVHVTRLEEIISEVDEAGLLGEKDATTAAFLASGENTVKKSDKGPVREAGLLASAQKAQHYATASYGEAIDWAKLLGFHRHVDLLQKNLNEKHADERLSAICRQANSNSAAA